MGAGTPKPVPWATADALAGEVGAQVLDPQARDAMGLLVRVLVRSLGQGVDHAGPRGGVHLGVGGVKGVGGVECVEGVGTGGNIE